MRETITSMVLTEMARGDISVLIIDRLKAGKRPLVPVRDDTR
ncbi:hypothetical protein GMO_25260 [Gluconobacter morbifer G707]|uniref:Uncharacterized protein n=1 Tax=Gluconobacter morbifer G707 TaxID=1088869 RepID=G6XLA3_9PROT|nr:hypothetical protein GMO_25260 [Gluconobacter morbifer G707]